MNCIFYHNPHSPYQFNVYALYASDSNLWKHLLAGRITMYNPFRTSASTGKLARGTIVVKRPNYIVLDVPPGINPTELFSYIRSAWLDGHLHDFDLADYPELFI